MQELTEIIIFSAISGITIFLGGIFGLALEMSKISLVNKDKFIHFMSSFTGGILISTIAFVFIPHSIDNLSNTNIILVFLSGSVFFLALDKIVQTRFGNISQLMAMLLDFIPEAIALGALLATNKKLGMLLALFIGMQNFPEAFNSYLDLKNNKLTPKKIITYFFFLSFAGVFVAVISSLILASQEQAISNIMLFASSGILYLIFQDIIPESKIKNSYSPSLGAAMGFLIGVISYKMVIS